MDVHVNSVCLVFFLKFPMEIVKSNARSSLFEYLFFRESDLTFSLALRSCTATNRVNAVRVNNPTVMSPHYAASGPH